MNKFFGTILLGLGLAYSPVAISETLAVQALNKTFSVKVGKTTERIQITFSPVENTSLNAFNFLCDRISEVLTKITSLNFRPKVQSLEIGVSDKTMEGGDIFVTDGKLFISSYSTADEIEAILVTYFDVRNETEFATYIAEPGMTVNGFLFHKAKVNSVLNQFKQAKTPLDLPEGLEIRLVPGYMNVGYFYEYKNQIFIASEATPEIIERFFIKFLPSRQGNDEN